MKLLIVVACALVGAVAALPQFQKAAQASPQTAASHAQPVRGAEEAINDAPDPYTFALEVNDDEFTNYQSRHESQDENGVVRGHYSYVAPNGVRITVTYTADAVNGYQATVKEEQTDIIVRNPLLEKHPAEHRTGPAPRA